MPIYIYIYRIHTNGSKRVFALKAGNEKEAEEWVKIIGEHIVVSNGKKKTITVREDSNFWKVYIYIYI